jgi:hypothetical protein
MTISLGGRSGYERYQSGERPPIELALAAQFAWQTIAMHISAPDR